MLVPQQNTAQRHLLLYPALALTSDATLSPRFLLNWSVHSMWHVEHSYSEVPELPQFRSVAWNLIGGLGGASKTFKFSQTYTLCARSAVQQHSCACAHVCATFVYVYLCVYVRPIIIIRFSYRV